MKRMKKNKEFDKLRFLSIKEVCELCGCSYVIAFNFRKEVANFFDIPTRLVTYGHYLKYLNLE